MGKKGSAGRGQGAYAIGERTYRVKVDRPSCVLACPVRQNGHQVVRDEAVHLADERLKGDIVGLLRRRVVSPRLHHLWLVALQRSTARLDALPSRLEMDHSVLKSRQATDVPDREDAGISGLRRA